MTGQTLGHYRIESKTRDEQFERQAAWKVLPRGTGEAARRRFRKERLEGLWYVSAPRWLLLFVFSCLPLPAGDWPRFRGPNGSGVADTTGLRAEFGPSKNVVWKTPLPAGHSSPILSGDRILLTVVEEQKLFTLCLSRRTGRVLWRRECPRPRAEPLDKRNHPASPTPAADGQNVFVFFPDFGLVSYGWDGHERWRTPLGPFNNIYGMGASPILAGDKVILVCDQSRDSFAAAFGKGDGRLRWKTSRPEAVSGHSTPILYQPGKGPLQILAPGSFRMDAYSSDTGEILWWANGLTSEMKSTPVLGADTVYINGYNTPRNDPGNQIQAPAFADVDADQDGRIARAEAGDAARYFPFIDLDRDGWLTPAEWKTYQASMAAENGLLAIRMDGSIRWKYQRAVPQLPSTLLYRGVLYMINDGGILTTLDPATGQVFKQGRLRGAVDNYFASPVAADGKVFFLSLAGIVSVLRAGPEQEILAVNELDDECLATPAIADGRIYIRTRSALYCFGES